jgi:hypothetical protein
LAAPGRLVSFGVVPLRVGVVSWGPDGRWAAAGSGPEGGAGLAIVDVESGDVRLLGDGEMRV